MQRLDNARRRGLGTWTGRLIAIAASTAMASTAMAGASLWTGAAAAGAAGLGHYRVALDGGSHETATVGSSATFTVAFTNSSPPSSLDFLNGATVHVPASFGSVSIATPHSTDGNVWTATSAAQSDHSTLVTLTDGSGLGEAPGGGVTLTITATPTATGTTTWVTTG